MHAIDDVNGMFIRDECGGLTTLSAMKAVAAERRARLIREGRTLIDAWRERCTVLRESKNLYLHNGNSVAGIEYVLDKLEALAVSGWDRAVRDEMGEGHSYMHWSFGPDPIEGDTAHLHGFLLSVCTLSNGEVYEPIEEDENETD